MCAVLKKKEQKCSVSLVTTAHRVTDCKIRLLKCGHATLFKLIVYWKSYWWILKIFFFFHKVEIM